MADEVKTNNVSSLDVTENNTLLKAIFPIDVSLKVKNTIMATSFAKSTHWQSLLLISQSQVQKNGLLFQVVLN